MTKSEWDQTSGSGSRFRFPPKGGEPPEPDHHSPCRPVPGTTREPLGTTQGDAPLPVLATLQAHSAGAIVADLALELGASINLVQRRLYSLRRQGLVTSEQLGTPPVTTWRCL
jgi:hypothetical protein